MFVFETLLDLLPEMESLGAREAVLNDNGFRVERTTYRELLGNIAGIARHLDQIGIVRGDRVLLWGENRAEWVCAYWACLARGITVVPLDFRSSSDFVSRVQSAVQARLLLCGAAVQSGALARQLPFIPFQELSRLSSADGLGKLHADSNDVVQVLFTSGTTGEPKGVVHRHRHLVSNLVPIGSEIAKYRGYARPFQPIRFLDLLPLSHVFGQFTGLFIPPLLGGSVAFMREVHPGAIATTIRRERISVLISVPRFLSNLRSELRRGHDLPEPPRHGRGLLGGLLRWWRYRKIHSLFGWKFWAVLSGGAPLPLEEESFWRNLGFVLVQGYGMTETSSLVTTNHPFHPRAGSLGKAVGDQQIRLASDGEILVRGVNVSQERYGIVEAAGEEEGWLHTGDLGEMAEDGTLYYKGRKKDVIVLPDGLNVYPSDVETTLARLPEVLEAVVIGEPKDGGELVHAVLLLRDRRTNAANLVQLANKTLEPHQRIQKWSVWQEEDFPRTASTYKVRRHEVTARMREGQFSRGPETRSASGVRAILAQHLGRSDVELDSSQYLSEELGLSSLDKIELLAALQEHYGREIPETVVAEASTLGDLERSVEEGASVAAEGPSSTPLGGLPRFAGLSPIGIARRMFREAVTLPLFRHYIPLTVMGDLSGVSPPVIFAPNHTSNLDTIALLAAVPRPFRNRIAPAVSQDYFLAYLRGTGTFRERSTLGLQYFLGVTLFNMFPLPQSTTGMRETLRFAGRRADRGDSILIFPEGRRTPDGKMHAFRAGVGLLAVNLQIPVVPVYIDGLYEVLPVHENWPAPGPARLSIGKPMRFGETEDYRRATARIEEAVRKLGGIT